MEDQNKPVEEKLPEGKPRNLSARVEAFKKFNEIEGRVITDEAPKPASEQTDGSQSKSDAEPKAENKGADASDEAPAKKAEDVQEPPKKEERKMVPLEALHETREKLKARTLEARQLEAKMEALSNELAEVKASLTKPREVQKPDTNPEVAELKRQLQAVQTELQKTKIVDAQKSAEEQAKQFEQRVNATDKELDESGFPGFVLARAAVESELAKMFQAGELTREECADPKVWKEVYVEKVFPTLEDRMEERKRRLTTDNKIAAKKKANLIVNPGSKPVENEDKEKEFTPEEYFKKRRMVR